MLTGEIGWGTYADSLVCLQNFSVIRFSKTDNWLLVVGPQCGVKQGTGVGAALTIIRKP